MGKCFRFEGFPADDLTRGTDLDQQAKRGVDGVGRECDERAHEVCSGVSHGGTHRDGHPIVDTWLEKTGLGIQRRRLARKASNHSFILRHHSPGGGNNLTNLLFPLSACFIG